MESIICNLCEAVFINREEMSIHMKRHCDTCNKFFLSAAALKRHKKTHMTVFCTTCKEDVKMSYFPYHKRTDKHLKVKIPVVFNNKLQVKSSDFQERIEIYTYLNEDNKVVLPEEFFKKARETVVEVLEWCSKKHITFKFNFELNCTFYKTYKTTHPNNDIDNDDDDGDKDDTGEVDKYQKTIMNMITKMTMLTQSMDIEEIYKQHSNDICVKMLNFQERDSGWSLYRINHLDININQVTINKVSGYIPLPPAHLHKGALINIKNHDIYCFKWCIIAAMYNARDLDARKMANPNSYRVKDITEPKIRLSNIVLHFDKMIFPLKLKDIKLFEALNDISVNVFGMEGKNIVGPYYLTSNEKDIHINLVLLTNEENSHFVLIKDMSK